MKNKISELEPARFDDEELLEMIEQARRDVKEGRTISQAEVKKRLGMKEESDKPSNRSN